MNRVVLAIVAATLALGLFAQPALADHLKAQLDVAAHTSVKVEQGYVLEAHLRSADGRSVGDATVRFYELVDFFGTRTMYLGSTTTDSQGLASFAYLPAQPGQRQIVVRFSGREHVSAAEAKFTLDATVAAPARREERSALAAFSDKVPYAVGVIVLAVWGLIGFAFLATARGVIGGARTHSGKEGRA